MIEIRELRIGNIVRFENTDVEINDIGTAWHTHRVLPIDKFTYPSRKTRVKLYSPIPLNRVSLAKCGFTIHEDYSILISHGIKITVWQDGDVQIEEPALKSEIIIEYGVFFLHTLQNLFFALIGKELPIR